MTPLVDRGACSFFYFCFSIFVVVTWCHILHGCISFLVGFEIGNLMVKCALCAIFNLSAGGAGFV